jgi:hypothetical protein
LLSALPQSLFGARAKLARLHHASIYFSSFHRHYNPMFDCDRGVLRNRIGFGDVRDLTQLVRRKFNGLDELARLSRAGRGSLGAFIKDRNSGTILLQQSMRRQTPARTIGSKLTAMARDDRAISVSGIRRRAFGTRPCDRKRRRGQRADACTAEVGGSNPRAPVDLVFPRSCPGCGDVAADGASRSRSTLPTAPWRASGFRRPLAVLR